MAAQRSDLDRVSATRPPSDTSDDSSADWCSRLDDQLLYHAKLLRRVRFDRAAIRNDFVAVRVYAHQVRTGRRPGQRQHAA